MDGLTGWPVIGFTAALEWHEMHPPVLAPPSAHSFGAMPCEGSNIRGKRFILALPTLACAPHLLAVTAFRSAAIAFFLSADPVHTGSMLGTIEAIDVP